MFPAFPYKGIFKNSSVPLQACGLTVDIGDVPAVPPFPGSTSRRLSLPLQNDQVNISFMDGTTDDGQRPFFFLFFRLFLDFFRRSRRNGQRYRFRRSSLLRQTAGKQIR